MFKSVGAEPPYSLASLFHISRPLSFTLEHKGGSRPPLIVKAVFSAVRHAVSSFSLVLPSSTWSLDGCVTALPLLQALTGHFEQPWLTTGTYTLRFSRPWTHVQLRRG